MSGIINMQNVTFTSQDRLIVKDFSYSFAKSKTTALVGPSGSGKSTVLKLSAGILVPTKGSIDYYGDDIFNMNRQENLAFRKVSSMVFQNSALWANQSLYQSLELPLRIHFPDMSASARKNRIAEVLADVGYRRKTDIRPDILSRGEQKLIAFARAIVCRPSLLYLDEWTESLDESASHRLLNLVEKYRAEQNTVIMVTHDFRIVRKLADYVIMIVSGEFALVLSKEEMDADEELVRQIERGISS
jgi:ABC-type multidrug transport system ATPase subunit